MGAFKLSDYVDTVGGETVVNGEGIALLLGLPAETVDAEFRRQRGGQEGMGTVIMPGSWARRGRLNAKRCKAATGSDDMFAALRFLHEEPSGTAG